MQPRINGWPPEAEAALRHGGLPYWMFWLLLCVVLLLLAFIFFRNKDLRQRLSLSLYSPRRRWERLTLQARLMREKKKRAGLLEALGRTALRRKAATKARPTLIRDLSELEAKLDDERGRLRKISTEMGSGPAPSGGTGTGLSPAMSTKGFRKDIKKILSDISALEKRQDPLLEELGLKILEGRPDESVFSPLYAQLDRIDESIGEITAALEALKND
jgi:hypothetical protein